MKNSILAIILLAAVPAYAVTPSVGEVKDNRTTGQFFAELEVELKLVGDDLADYQAVRTLIEKATDDTGRDILNAKDEPEFEKLNDGYGSGNTLRLKFKNPARKASAISEVSGKLEFYKPAADPDATVTVTGLNALGGKPVQSPALKALGIEFTVLTSADYKKQQEDKKAKAQEEARKQGMSEEMVQEMTSFMGMFSDVGENSLMLEVKDPQQKIVDYKLVDASGKEISRQSTMTSGDTKVIDFSEKIPADAKLQINLLTTKALAMVPLKLTNIALP